MRKYYKHQVEKVLQIKNLVTIEYQDMEENYVYPTETHDFYELIYVEKGSLTCKIEDHEFSLTQNDFILIDPNKSHSYYLNEKQTSKNLIICFNSKSEILGVLKGKIVLSEREKTFISDIIMESRKCFVFPFKKKLVPLNTPRFGSQQLVESYIEQLLISVIRKTLDNKKEIMLISNKEEFNQHLTEDIINLLKENIYDEITLDDVCNRNYYSKTYLNNVFKSVTRYSIMQYYNMLKINEAKRLLKKGESITSVSVKLCFSSQNYFTKVFKKFAGKNPSELKK